MLAKSQTATRLDAEINAALEELEKLERTSEEYGELIDRIARLHKLKIDEEQSQLKTEEVERRLESDSKIKPPSMDTVLIVTANVFGVLWLTRFERENVITATKAFGSIIKLPR